MKPAQVVDEMFPEGPFMDCDEMGGSNLMSVEISPERFVHVDFQNDFGELFDDEDLD